MLITNINIEPGLKTWAMFFCPLVKPRAELLGLSATRASGEDRVWMRASSLMGTCSSIMPFGNKGEFSVRIGVRLSTGGSVRKGESTPALQAEKNCKSYRESSGFAESADVT